MSWILFSILAAFVLAIVSIIDKYVLTKWIKKPIVIIMIFGAIGLIVSIIVYFVHGFSELSYFNILLAFVSGIFFISGIFFYFKAVRIEEISRVAPLTCLTPLFVSIFAFVFLGEFFAPIKYLGIVAIVIGAILISVKGSLKINPGKAFWLMILFSIFMAINHVITKYLLNFADFWTIFSWMRVGVFVALIPIYITNFSDILSIIKEHGKKVIFIISFSECLTLAGFLLITIAASISSATMVNALYSTQPLFVLFFTIILSIFYPRILKEEIGKSIVLQKFVAIILILGGALLVS